MLRSAETPRTRFLLQDVYARDVDRCSRNNEQQDEQLRFETFTTIRRHIRGSCRRFKAVFLLVHRRTIETVNISLRVCFGTIFIVIGERHVCCELFEVTLEIIHFLLLDVIVLCLNYAG